MGLTKPNQQLQRDLKGIAFNLEQSCIDLGRLASRLNEPDTLELMRVVGALYGDADRLKVYADEVKAGRIVRGKDEQA
ncbi:hypothetical protein HX866_04160 [Pseudomonas gingeri]|uniref:hypothetical protein n=1 Tax=Pseudomonas gingeri TaxID=117681 RepID=UPI0015A18500|nr:hypothetical protein [Pseudomonas gingeri]NWA24077.1 hypothetical protein [Pseudomonas gingeri]